MFNCLERYYNFYHFFSYFDKAYTQNFLDNLMNHNSTKKCDYDQEICAIIQDLVKEFAGCLNSWLNHGCVGEGIVCVRECMSSSAQCKNKKKSEKE